MSREEIKQEVLRFVKPESHKPEFYGWYADYDWVLFCQLFGTMMDLPKHFPMYCRDVKQMADETAIKLKYSPILPGQENEHNALDDARWIKKAYDYIMQFHPTE